jgi:uroporphyrinogen-III synthase
MSSEKYVVITRSDEDKTFADALSKLDLKTLSYPTTKQIKNLSSTEFSEYFSLLSSYDWLIFTSSNGVKFFIEAVKELGADIKQFSQLKIATVGEKTAETARHHGLSVDFTPPKFTSNDLTQQMPPVKGKKILIPRSAIGNPELETHLEQKGAIVTAMPLYTTITQENNMEEFWNLFLTNKIFGLTFTSPSTIEGFLQNIGEKKEQILNLPVYSIGPTTTAAVKKHGFTKIYTAETHTIEGMVRKIKESIL